MLAVSSHLSTGHLINVMYDPLGNRLLRQYATLYRDYFDLYGHVIRSQGDGWADAAKPLMSEAREQMAIVRQHINSEQPDHRHADFDQQALLARSGRYPVCRPRTSQKNSLFCANHIEQADNYCVGGEAL